MAFLNARAFITLKVLPKCMFSHAGPITSNVILSGPGKERSFSDPTIYAPEIRKHFSKYTMCGM